MIHKKRINLFTIILPGIIFLTIGALTAGDLPTEAPDELTIDNTGYKKDKKKPVLFGHKEHAEEYINAEGKKIDCTECHHKYDEKGKNLWKEGDPVQRCGASDCHDPLKKKSKNQHKLQLAYHKNCKDCHKAVKKAYPKKDAPFKKCNACMKTK
jgi:hypothetical protein